MKKSLVPSLLASIILIGVGLAGIVYITSIARLPGEARAHGLPDLQVTRLDGTTIYLRDFQGKPLIVNFWATWCPPCIEEMPALEDLHRSMSGEISVVAVNLGEDPEVVQAYLDQHSLTLPVLLDQSGQVAHALDIGYLPATLFVDAQGVVRSSYKGALTPEQMQKGATALGALLPRP